MLYSYTCWSMSSDYISEDQLHFNEPEALVASSKLTINKAGLFSITSLTPVAVNLAVF
jgi:hypothetical protein